MSRSESDAAHYLQCSADACKQGRQGCPCPQACEISEGSFVAAHLVIAAILVAFIGAWSLGVFG